MIYYKKDIDDIVTLTLDMAGRSTNILNHEISKAFIPVIGHLQKEKNKGALKGVIITSAKRTFLVGGDLDYLYYNKDMNAAFEYSESLQNIFREFEAPGVPVVAALNGSAVGNGFELALACHYRVALDQPEVHIGSPEVNLGLMPGSGGCIRLLWLLGLERAFEVLSNGKMYSAREALNKGLVDAIASTTEEMMQIARDWIFAHHLAQSKWDTSDGRITGGTVKDPEIALKARKLGAQLVKKYRNNFPAPLAILDTLVEGSKVDFTTACRIESRYFASLWFSQEARNMTKLFWYDLNDLKSGKTRPSGFGKFRPQKTGIIGAGNMGCGIAVACLLNGQRVILKDISKAVADRGRKSIKQKLKAMEAEGTLAPDSSKKILDKLVTTEKVEDFETCDIVIETVFENKIVKNKVTKEADSHIDRYAIFASNTSSIPISELATASSRPENFIGLRFFSPAESVSLVEIIKGATTSQETVARAYDFVKAIKKSPIIATDTPGFFASRVRNTYILEGVSLIQEGIDPAFIENMGRQAGMPLGPLATADDLSLKLVLAFETTSAKHYGAKYQAHLAVPILQKMVEELERPGKYKQAGFYTYNKEERLQIWPELTTHFGAETVTEPPIEIKSRLLMAQVVEALWCLEEGVITSISEANIASVRGWGFPAFKGGIIQYIFDMGQKPFQELAKKLEEKFGQRFQLPPYFEKHILNAENNHVLLDK